MSLATNILGLMQEGEAFAEKIKTVRKSLPQGETSAAETVANLTLAQRSAEGAVDKLVRIMSDLDQS